MLWLCLFSLVAAALPARAQLPAAMVRALAEAGIPEDAVGVLVAPVARGPRLLEHNADRALQPASTMKLVTTLVGLEQLGPTWRGRTRLMADGAVSNGVLAGDLVLVGGGDIDLDTAALRTMLRRARDRGLKELRGDLVLDRSYFQPTRVDIGLPPFDERPEAAYNVIPDALLVDENLIRVELFVDERGLQVVPLTPLHNVKISHEMTLVEGDCSIWDDVWKLPEIKLHRLTRQIEVVLRGAWPAGCDREVAMNVLDRNDFIARQLRALWASLGGVWRIGKVREGVAPPQAQLLAEHESRALSELVRSMNKSSRNSPTRTLYLAIGRAEPGEPREPTLQRAERAVRSWLRRQGASDEGLVLDNGSGLSRRERITPAQLEAVVRAGLASRWAPEFTSSLPIAGLDGTLGSRLSDSAAAGWARMKTGTLRNAVALAGTVPDGAGQPRIVVVMVNHDNVRPRQTRQILDAFIDWVTRRRFDERLAAEPVAAPGAAAASPVIRPTAP